MKDVFLLTNILLKGSKGEVTKNKNSKLKIFGYFIIYIYIAGVVGFISYEAINSLKLINQEAVFVNLGFTAVLSFILMQTLFTSINLLFFSKDIEYLLPLPLKPQKIIMAKLNCLIINEYIICSILLVPILLMYGIIMKLSLFFYVLSLGIILLIPILPVVIVSLVITIVMKFTNIIRNKDFVQYVTVALSIILILGVQFLSVFGNEQITDVQLANMLIEANGLVEVYSKFFITLKPIMQCILNYYNIQGIFNFVILIAESFVAYFVITSIMAKMYIKTVTNTSIATTGKNKKNVAKKYLFKKNKVSISYIKKEFKILIKNPVFLMQCVIPSILFPLIMILPTYMSFKNTNSEMLDLKYIISNATNTTTGIATIISVIIFFFLLNFISVTAISRDGKSATFMKYIPIKLEKQCFYKIMPGIILNTIPVIYVIAFLKIIVPQIENYHLLYIILTTTLINIYTNYMLILIDLKRPKLHWTTEYAVVKQNMNMLFEMIIYVFEIIFILILGNLFKTIEIFILTVTFVFIFLLIKIRSYLYNNEIKLFKKII